MDEQRHSAADHPAAHHFDPAPAATPDAAVGPQSTVPTEEELLALPAGTAVLASLTDSRPVQVDPRVWFGVVGE